MAPMANHKDHFLFANTGFSDYIYIYTFLKGSSMYIEQLGMNILAN